MFTGIVQGLAQVCHVQPADGVTRFVVRFPERQELAVGASVAINGVCLTVTECDGETACFDLLPETCQRSNLGQIQAGDHVNYERSARFGDEIGGHVMSGHVAAMARVVQVEDEGESRIVRMTVDPQWHRYLFEKGYIGLNGASLTLVDVDRAGSTFSVHLIPETLRLTTFGEVCAGDWVNVEVDAMTQAVVETVERMNRVEQIPTN